MGTHLTKPGRGALAELTEDTMQGGDKHRADQPERAGSRWKTAGALAGLLLAGGGAADEYDEVLGSGSVVQAWTNTCNEDSLTGKTSSCEARGPESWVENAPPQRGGIWGQSEHALMQQIPWKVIFRCYAESEREETVVIGYFPYVGISRRGNARGVGDTQEKPVSWKMKMLTGSDPDVFQGTFVPNGSATRFVQRNSRMRIEFAFGDSYLPIFEWDGTGSARAIQEARRQCKGQE